MTVFILSLFSIMNLGSVTFDRVGTLHDCAKLLLMVCRPMAYQSNPDADWWADLFRRVNCNRSSRTHSGKGQCYSSLVARAGGICTFHWSDFDMHVVTQIDARFLDVFEKTRHSRRTIPSCRIRRNLKTVLISTSASSRDEAEQNPSEF